MGLIPGIILIVGLGIIASYSGYVIGQFKLQYPSIRNFGDSFEIMFSRLGPKWGRFGYELGGIGQLIFTIFVMASHILTWIICFDTITDHATCKIVWGVVALAVFWIIDLPQSLKIASYWSIACKCLPPPLPLPKMIFRILIVV